MTDFQRHILQGIPATLPPKAVYDPSVSHAPKRKSILTKEEETDNLTFPFAAGINIQKQY